MNLVAEELERTDEAFARNRLLATFPAEARALIEPQASVVDLDLGSIVHASGADVVTTFFPFGPTMISLCVDLADGRTVEVASIGQEGAVGGIVSCGHAPAFAHSEVIVAGPALRVPMTILEEAKARSGHIRNLFCRFSDYLLAQVMQSVACNAFHPIEARCSRWLLTAHDRVEGETIPLTQEYLAEMLGVQRTSVSPIAKQLQDKGLIRYRRGRIEILDREQLERSACECYRVVERHFAAILPEPRPQKLIDASDRTA